MTSHSGDLSLSVSMGDASFAAQGDSALVLDVYRDFKELIASGQSRDGVTPPAEITRDSPGSGTQTQSGQTDLPLKPFLSGLDLKGNKEKATSIVAWAAASGMQDALTVTEIEKFWKKAPFKAPSNLRRDVRKAEAEGWLHREGKEGSPDATYQLTGYGHQTLESWHASTTD